MDERFKSFENCEVFAVYQKMNEYLTHEEVHDYMITISIPQKNSVFPNYINISLEALDLYDKLKELIDGKKDRVYAAYGMADIDFFYQKNKNQYCIEWSPNEGCYRYFYVSKEEFMKLVNALKPDSEKLEMRNQNS